MGYKVTTVRLPDETLDEINELTDTLSKERSELIREIIRVGVTEVKLRHGIEEYQKGKISLGKLSEFTDIGYRELQLELAKRGVTQRYGEERLEELDLEE
jgi:predicted HTH domain antitoxin